MAGSEEKKKESESSRRGERGKIVKAAEEGKEEKKKIIKDADGEKKEKMEVKYAGDRKNLVASLSTILHPQYLGLPSYAYQIGEYRVEKDGTLTGPADEKIKNK